MSSQIREKPEVIDRKTIVPKSFYIRTERTKWDPLGIIKMYRITRSPPPSTSEFTYQAVRIKNPEELTRTKLALDWLAGELNWQELPEVLEKFKKQLEPDEKTISPETLRLVRQYPHAASEILKGFDAIFRGHVEIEDFPIIQRVITSATTLLENQTKYMTEAKIELFEKLNHEKSPEGIKRLTKMLEEYDLPRITSVASIIMSRLQRLEYLKATIEKESAYELKGKDSVHNQLATALWIIDDSYWLLYSNKTLATFLEKKVRAASSYEKKRPDLICANNNYKLIIVELKRPSHKIKQKDINQLYNNLITADQFRGTPFKEKKGYLIGKEISPHDKKYIDGIHSLKFIPYLQLVEDCERRYQEYLTALEEKGD
jgi:hypothetical protein